MTIHTYASQGDLDGVREELAKGVSIEARDERGYTPLVNIVYCLHDSELLVPVAEFLVRSGAEIDCVTDYGESPLSVASFQGRFDAVKYLLDAGADPSPLNWTALMKAVALGSSDEVEGLLEASAGLNERDGFDRTPWLLASFIGDLEKAKLLHAAGANMDQRGRCGETALMYCATRNYGQLLEWLIRMKADIEAVDESGNTALMLAAQAGSADCVHLLLEAGANPSSRNEYGDNAMRMASTEETVRMLAEAGEEIGDISTKMKRELIGLHGGDSLRVTESEYLSGKAPRFGKSNPEVMHVPFWREMVRVGISAYQARKQFADTDSMENPVWCFSRYGSSFTELPDGRFVQIGGEHEDFYDPDFCIYNDVVVHEPSGDFQIMGYPKQVFSPTDFHSANYIHGYIYLIGGLGYAGAKRYGETPIYRLSCQTWKIEAIQSSGDNPGWIYEHQSRFVEPGLLVVSNGKICDITDGEEQQNSDQFFLDLANMKWSRRRAG